MNLASGQVRAKKGALAIGRRKGRVLHPNGPYGNHDDDDDDGNDDDDDDEEDDNDDNEEEEDMG